MIEKTIKIHDKFSIEIKLGYQTRRSKKINEYSITTWIFVPNSLDINRYTYSKNQFYNDLKTYIRLSSPSFLLREIAEGENSPFILLEKAFWDFSNAPLRKNAKKYEHHIKMFLSILNSALRNEIEHINKNEVVGDEGFLIKSYLKHTLSIAKKYRKLRRIINVPTVGAKHLTQFLLSDEHMSNLIEKYTFTLIRMLDENFPEAGNKYKDDLQQIIENEVNYKAEQDWPIIRENDAENNGLVVYRRGVLKKYIDSQLFLSTRRKKDGAFAEQLLFSVAAGLSMVFATIVAFIFQQRYGNFTLPFFVALVIGYMLKDRIKELTRFYLSTKLLKAFFDHKTIVGLNKGQKFGWCKEGFDFVPEEKMPQKVLDLRNQSRTLNIGHVSSYEKILLYRKLTRLYRGKLKQVYQDYELTGINDILRFNIFYFTTKMDDPKVPVHLFKNSELQTFKADKLYNLNLIMKLESDGETDFLNYRIVFNKSGIKKVIKI